MVEMVLLALTRRPDMGGKQEGKPESFLMCTQNSQVKRRGTERKKRNCRGRSYQYKEGL